VKDERKTKSQLVKELADLRHQIDGLRKGELGLKQAVEALQQSEIRFKELADLLPQTVFEFDEEGKLLFVNRNAFSMFGFSQEDFEKGLNAFQTIVPEDRDRAKENIQTALRGEKVGPSEYTLLRRDGSTFPAVVYSSPVLKGNGPVGLRGIVIDITDRKRAEAALRESEERLRALFDHAAAGITLVDTNGRVLATNQADCRFLGYSQEEIVGMHFADFTHPEDLNADEALYESLLKGQRDGYVIDKRYVRKDGEIVWGRLSVSLIRDQEGQAQYSVVVCEDITDRKRAEETIREGEARYRAVLQQSPDGIYLVDVETRQVMEANSAFQKILGYTYSETLGLSFPDFVVGNREDLDRRFMDVLSGKGPFTFERKYRRKDGSLLDVWVSTRVISFGGRKAILVLVRDLTERKWAEEALQDSEARYRAVVEQSPDAIYLVDINTKLVVETNTAFQEMFGCTAEESLKLSSYDIVAADRKDIDERFQTILEARGPVSYERRCRRCDESFIDVWCSVSVISYGGRKVVCTLVRDLTERKRAEAERERIIGELQEALSRIKTLRGLIPICANCKKIRDDKGYWQQVDSYVRKHSEAQFSHGLCPECIQILFADLKGDKSENGGI